MFVGETITYSRCCKNVRWAGVMETRQRGLRPKPRGARRKAVQVGSDQGLKALLPPPAILWLCWSEMECPGNDLCPQMKLRDASKSLKG